MNIFITGVAGFIGSNLAEYLLKFGHKILGIDNFDPFYDKSIKIKNISSLIDNSNFLFKEADIRDKTNLNNAINEFGPEVIIHLAAKAGVRSSINNPEDYIDTNIKGTLNILEIMKSNDIKKLIFSSSSSVYGNLRNLPFSEDEYNLIQISPYAFTKYAAEYLCKTYSNLYNQDIFCFRFFTVYGPKQRPDMAINIFFNKIMKNEEIILYGDGTTKRDYTYIDDIISGIDKSLNHFNQFQIINLGGSEVIRLNELVKQIEGILQKKAKIKFNEKKIGDVEITYAKIEKAKNLFGYNPQVNIREGLSKYYEWLKTNK